MDKFSFKAQLAAAIILLVVMIPFFWHDEKVGYALGEDGKLATEQECAQATNASWEDWIACLMVHGVSDCVMIYKLSDFFEDKGCLRYIKKNNAKATQFNETSSALCEDDDC